MGRQKKTIRVKVRRAPNITDNFLIIPNDMPRGHGEWAGLSAEARILLMAGLSCKDDWDEATLEDLEGWLEDLGRDRQEAVRRELRERGYMTLRQSRIPEGPDAGMFEWTFEFHMHALSADKRDQLKAKTAAKRTKKVSMPGVSGNGEDQQVSAGHSMPGISGHGNAGNGGAGTDVQGGVPYIEKEHLEKKQNPPTPAESTTAAPEGVKVEGGDSSTSKPEATIPAAVTWLMGFRVVQQLAARYPNWKPEVMSEVLAQAVADGRGDLRLCSKTLLGLAKSGDTQSARRLLASGPWWTTDRPFIPAPSPAEAGEPCDVKGHVGVKGGCTACAGDAKAGSSDDTLGAVNPQRAAAAEGAFRASLVPGASRARLAMAADRQARDILDQAAA